MSERTPGGRLRRRSHAAATAEFYSRGGTLKQPSGNRRITRNLSLPNGNERGPIDLNGGWGPGGRGRGGESEGEKGKDPEGSGLLRTLKRGGGGGGGGGTEAGGGVKSIKSIVASLMAGSEFSSAGR